MKLSALIPLTALLLTEGTMAQKKTRIEQGIDKFFRQTLLNVGNFKEAPFDNLRNVKANFDKIMKKVNTKNRALLLMNMSVTDTSSWQWAQWLSGRQLQNLADQLQPAIRAIATLVPYIRGKVFSQLKLSEADISVILQQKEARFKPFQVNDMNKKFLKKHGKAFIENFQRNSFDLSRLNEKTLIAILSKKEAVEALNVSQLDLLFSRRKFVKLLGPKFMKHATAVIRIQWNKGWGTLIRDFPDNAFAEIKNPIDPSWFQYMTEAQMRNFQSKSLKKGAPCQLRLSAVGAQAIPGLWPKLMSRYFKENPNSMTVKSNRLWKRIPLDVFKKLCKEDDEEFPEKLPRKAFSYMTMEQRQVFLDTLGDSCHALPPDIFKGRVKYWSGLKVGKKCFQSMNENENRAQMRFRAIVFGLVEPEHTKDIEVSEIKKWRYQHRRAGKKGDKKKVDMKGVVALEALAKNARGPEYVKVVLKEDADEKCKTIDVEQLKAATWLQDQLSGECIRHIKDLDSDVGKKMSPNIWANLKWKQLKQIHSGDFSDLRDNAYKGLSKNKAFAEHACKSKAIKEKKQKDGKTHTKSLLQKLDARKVRANFVSSFINMVPEADRDCLARNIGLFNGQILTDVEASVVAALVKGGKVSDEQFGHASDNVAESRSYPASLSASDVAKLTVGQVGAMSATFLERMKDTAIAALTEDQVKAIPASNLTKICGTKAAAFKHLSEDQKAHLSRDCPAAPEKALAPCPYSASSILAIAAAAAGGAAFVL